MTSSTLLADPPSNETIDVFYIKTETVVTLYWMAGNLFWYHCYLGLSLPSNVYFPSWLLWNLSFKDSTLPYSPPGCRWIRPPDRVNVTIISASYWWRIEICIYISNLFIFTNGLFVLYLKSSCRRVIDGIIEHLMHCTPFTNCDEFQARVSMKYETLVPNSWTLPCGDNTWRSVFFLYHIYSLSSVIRRTH